VTVFEKAFVDESRPSPASNTQPAAPERTLVTTIAYPTGTRRPLPLVLLAHGANGNPNKFTQLIDTWARAGYVVVAPLFPRSSDTGGNLVGDYVEQPADLSFVLDHVVRMNRGKTSPLRGRIDPDHIGLAGLSLGGFTTYGTVFNSCCRDGRVDAAILMSAVFGPFPSGTYDFRSVPTLLLHGDADGLYPHSVNAYPQLAAPKWFVTIQGGTHAFPFEDTPEASDELVKTVTVAFWDRSLKGERRAAQEIVDAVDTSGLATLQREPAG
jgi:predicted dienelactone hydrolase